MKKIIITNGSGGCGKDTFAKIARKYIRVIKYSSIDFFKQIGILGRMGLEKGEPERKLLYNLKQAFIEYNDLPTILCSEKIEKFLMETQDGILIIDIREPNEIKKLIAKYPEIISVLILNKNTPMILSNSGDANVFDYNYDYIIDNSYNLDTLEQSIKTFLIDIGFTIKK